MALINVSRVVLPTFLFSACTVMYMSSHLAMAAQLCPSPIPNGTFCITSANSPYNAPRGWIGASNIIMENNTILKFDPSINSEWNISMGTLVVGDNVHIELNGADSEGTGDAGRNGRQGDSEANGEAGSNGKNGLKGGDTAKLNLSVEKMLIGNLTFDRIAGHGQQGGPGGRGGRGGDGSCYHNGGDGAIGGVGGKGGPGGDAKAVKIIYGTLDFRQDIKIKAEKLKKDDVVEYLRLMNTIGINNNVKVGIGGFGGTSGYGGGSGPGVSGCGLFPVRWNTGGGIDRSHELPASLGSGQNGAEESFVLQQKTKTKVLSKDNGISVNFDSSEIIR